LFALRRFSSWLVKIGAYLKKKKATANESHKKEVIAGQKKTPRT